MLVCDKALWHGSGRYNYAYTVPTRTPLTGARPPASTLGLAASIALLPVLPSAASTSTAWSAQHVLPTSGPPTSGPSTSGSPVSTPARPTLPTFRLASSFPPIPGKLAQRIQALEFVEMRELLPDNVALAERLEALPTWVQPTKHPEQREVGSLLIWVSSFATYVAVVAQAHPDRVTDMLAYMRLIVREARKYGGNGWLTYDTVFRRNQAGRPNPWNFLDPSLHMAYIGGQSTQPLIPCHHCNEVDHCSEDCAIAPTVTPTKSVASRNPDRPQPPRSAKRPLAGRYPSAPKRICISWNRGKCLFPGACSYSHTCATCREEHQAKDCPHTPADSTFKQAKAT